MDPYDPYASTPVRYPSTSSYVSVPTPSSHGSGAYGSSPYAGQAYDGGSRRQGLASTPSEVAGAPTGNARYRCMMLPTGDDDDIINVVAQVGLDGVKCFAEGDADGATPLRAFTLTRVAKWTLTDPTILTVTIKGDGSDVVLAFSADKPTISALMDVLTTSAFQWCELNGHDALGTVVSTNSGNGAEWTNLKASVGADVRASPLTGRMVTDAGVRYWENPEYGGWLFKQGEHFRTWRRRWFVLKDGHLAWFKKNVVNDKSCVRGVIPLSTIDSVSIATDSTVGRPYGIHIAGAHAMKVGAQFLVAESEQERKFWMDALQRAMQSSTQSSSEQLSRGFTQAMASTPTSMPARAPTAASPQAYADTSNIHVEVQVQPSCDSYRSLEPTRATQPVPGASYMTLPALPFAHPSSAAGSAAFTAPPSAPVSSDYYSSAAYPAVPSRAPQPQAAAPPSDWTTYHTPEGKPYYYNACTGVTSWEAPQ
mmetsp:Transcript_1489/g.4676  ORF Transcript_1489/g.4676 Transcript_1489/m.4676 type:complete len:480 (+) Transcript_1489:180-1619(+)